MRLSKKEIEDKNLLAVDMYFPIKLEDIDLTSRTRKIIQNAIQKNIPDDYTVIFTQKYLMSYETDPFYEGMSEIWSLHVTKKFHFEHNDAYKAQRVIHENDEDDILFKNNVKTIGELINLLSIINIKLEFTQEEIDELIKRQEGIYLERHFPNVKRFEYILERIKDRKENKI